jgi:hypothetical protein
MLDRSLPNAKSFTEVGDRERLQCIIRERGLAGLANDTKWNELINAMRQRRQGEIPVYRCQCVDGFISHWDCEWFYHLPFPLLSIEWMDLANPAIDLKRNATIIEHSRWMVDLLQKIGLDFRVGSGMIRVFGYYPRNDKLFDQWASTTS